MNDHNQPNLKIGPYSLGKTLGIGAFGKVKIGIHDKTRHIVAVKILDRKKIQTLNMNDKVQREIRMLKIFWHPHIIRLYEVIYTKTDIFMIMEFIEGGELFDYILKSGKLSEDQARKFFQQIISGVAYCHQRRVVHRDIKPENLLLDRNHNVKVADFGLSNIMEDGNFLTTSCGSPNYASPEVISGNHYAGPEIDVWSCGVVLYALLCGRLPFDEEQISVLFQKIKLGKFRPPLETLSDSSKNLISRMLEVDPVKRITIDEIMQHPWFIQDIPEYIIKWYQLGIETPKSLKILDKQTLRDLSKTMKIPKKKIKNLLKKGKNSELVLMYKLFLDKKYKNNPEYIPEGFSPDNFSSEKSPFLSYGEISPITSPKSPFSPKPRNKTIIQQKTNWCLGIQTTDLPQKVMHEVYRALSLLNFEWKIFNIYHIRCRPKKIVHDNFSDISNTNNRIHDLLQQNQITQNLPSQFSSQNVVFEFFDSQLNYQKSNPIRNEQTSVNYQNNNQERKNQNNRNEDDTKVGEDLTGMNINITNQKMKNEKNILDEKENLPNLLTNKMNGNKNEEKESNKLESNEIENDNSYIHYVKVDLKLFIYDYSTKSLMLDFRKIKGGNFPFFNFCAQLIKLMRIKK
ncbi:non-specific serine/threonine protein kinase [Anaeramoeba ignava]|uniref:non-specific serine/threonine protein kinase n=1 Tax=Anaeramoeba ignava TaxID=1746090 RepID=A0A9Q0LIV3_ANAIG|nr:non-specific serine/threonine protein kinase [Anaeramoeba ignava]